MNPNSKNTLTPFDRIIEWSGWMALIFLWCFVSIGYTNLPLTIPTHFNVYGLADGFGNRTSIFILPIIGTIIFAALTALNRFPHIYTAYKNISPLNKIHQTRYGIKMTRFLKSAIVIIFGLIVLFTYLTATQKIGGLGLWFLPFTLVMLLLPTAYYIIKSLKSLH